MTKAARNISKVKQLEPFNLVFPLWVVHHGETVSILS